MIISRLMGGLGNQMFQYAAARALAERHKTHLKLDLSFLLDRRPRPHFTFRGYDLGIFNIQEAFATPDDLTHNVRIYPSRIAKWLGSFNPGAQPWNLITEKHHHFDPAVLQAPDHSYLVGYWQSEKYFKSIEAALRSEFTFKHRLSDEGEAMAATIRSTANSVCLHVRRGDFVDNPVATRWHGVCDLKYYTEGVSLVSNKLRTPHLFVFSDDLPWCREHLLLDAPKTFVELSHVGTQPEEHLALMSMCEHYLISNSSFAWWAVWLNDRSSRLVISPKRWFTDPSMRISDMIPDDWIRL
jgi:Glycosyl transferase family 11